MAISTAIKRTANRALGLLNLRLETRTAEKEEIARLRNLAANGHFDKLVFPVLPHLLNCTPDAIFDLIAKQAPFFAELATTPVPHGFSFENAYFTTPDAEVLSAIVTLYRPKRIVEIGSGNSTRLFRTSVNHNGLSSRITSIDPRPRRDIDRFADKIVRTCVETLPDGRMFEALEENDILFIDSSHDVRAGSDVTWLMLSVLPVVRPGVIVHFHDIFLPYEYPKEWIISNGWPWNEQYLLQAFLTGNVDFEVLWPGYYLQQTIPDFAAHFRQWRKVDARSFWMRRL